MVGGNPERAHPELTWQYLCLVERFTAIEMASLSCEGPALVKGVASRETQALPGWLWRTLGYWRSSSLPLLKVGYIYYYLENAGRRQGLGFIKVTLESPLEGGVKIGASASSYIWPEASWVLAVIGGSNERRLVRFWLELSGDTNWWKINYCTR